VNNRERMMLRREFLQTSALALAGHAGFRAQVQEAPRGDRPAPPTASRSSIPAAACPSAS
jgi:hypothetical protein